ncbi:MAG: TatD family hydrolase [Gammaproteobacteria bacterium]|nr:TatD family hydrolase [Gammaproteobacteria bacterium]
MIDIGANLTNAAFADDCEDVLERAHAADVAAIVVTGTSVRGSRAALALAEARSALFATAGVHPHDAADAEPGWAGELARLSCCPAVVAIGETGLDYHRDYSPRPEQRRVFRRQVELAVETGKPLFVHDRESGGDTRTILADYRSGLSDCVIHCFTGTAEDLEGYLDDGWHIGITGWVCDERRGRDLAGLVSRIPDDRLLIETDAPYLLPRTMTPRPRSRRNEPAFLGWVARRVAECRGAETADIERLTHANAARFFRLPEPFAAPTNPSRPDGAATGSE